MSYLYQTPPPLSKKGELEAVLARRRQRLESGKSTTAMTPPGQKRAPRVHKQSPSAHPFRKTFRSPRHSMLGGKDHAWNGDAQLCKTSSSEKQANILLKSPGTGEADDSLADISGPTSARTVDSSVNTEGTFDLAIRSLQSRTDDTPRSVCMSACNSERCVQLEEKLELAIRSLEAKIDSSVGTCSCSSERFAELKGRLELADRRLEVQAEKVQQALAQSATARFQSERAMAEVARLDKCLVSSQEKVRELESLVKTLMDRESHKEIDLQARLHDFESHKYNIGLMVGEEVQILEAKILTTVNAKFDNSWNIHAERVSMLEEETRQLRMTIVEECIRLQNELTVARSRSNSTFASCPDSCDYDMVPFEDQESSWITEVDKNNLDDPPDPIPTSRSSPLGPVPVLDTSRSSPLSLSLPSCHKPEVFFMSPRKERDASGDNAVEHEQTDFPPVFSDASGDNAVDYEQADLPPVFSLPLHSAETSAHDCTGNDTLAYGGVSTFASTMVKCLQSANLQCVLLKSRASTMKMLLCGLFVLWLYLKRRHPAARQWLNAAKRFIQGR